MDVITGNVLRSVATKSCLEIDTNKLCSYCGKLGHKFSECRLRQKDGQEKSEKANLAKSVERNPGYDNELGFVFREVTKSENKETMPQSKDNGGWARNRPCEH